LWALALSGQERAVGFGLIIAGLTDVLDGRLARHLDAETGLGSRLDSIADAAMGFSAFGWLMLLHPSIVHRHPVYFSAAPLIAVIVLWLGWQKFHKLADFHLASGRAAGIAGYLFLIQLFTLGRTVEAMLWLLMALSWIVAIEAMIIVTTQDSVDHHVPSPLVGYLTAAAGRGRGGD